MSSLANDRILLHADASTFAFRAGQLLEELLIERGIETARQMDMRAVTVDHMRSCVDVALINHLCERLGDSVHGEDGHKQRKTA